MDGYKYVMAKSVFFIYMPFIELIIWWMEVLFVLLYPVL